MANLESRENNWGEGQKVRKAVVKLVKTHQHLRGNEKGADSLEKTLMLEKIECRRRRGRRRMRWLDSISNLVDMSLSTPGDSKGQGGLACCSPWGRKELDLS